jgi:NTP pyrophosphatase (non-canonical NTP hydrolase)
MLLNEYQFEASKYRGAKVPASEREAGLVEEVGEIFGVLKRYRRGDYDNMAEGPYTIVQGKLEKEFGDVLWYLSQMMYDWEFQLEDVAKINLAKLEDRRLRKVIKGVGGER